MTNFKKNKGDYLDLMPNGKAGTLGTGKCSCGATNEIKINVAGWPYRFCPAKNCGAQEKSAGDQSAALLIARIDHYSVRNVKKKARTMAGLMPQKEKKPSVDYQPIEPVRAPEPQKPEPVPEPVQEHVPPRKKEPLIKFQLFGKDL